MFRQTTNISSLLINKTGTENTSDCPSVEELLDSRGDETLLPLSEINPAEDICVLPFSSGTTGVPKGVMLSHRNIVGNICQVRLFCAIISMLGVFFVLPPVHARPRGDAAGSPPLARRPLPVRDRVPAPALPPLRHERDDGTGAVRGSKDGHAAKVRASHVRNGH